MCNVHLKTRRPRMIRFYKMYILFKYIICNTELNPNLLSDREYGNCQSSHNNYLVEGKWKNLKVTASLNFVVALRVLCLQGFLFLFLDWNRYFLTYTIFNHLLRSRYITQKHDFKEDIRPYSYYHYYQYHNCHEQGWQ